jgi:D-3-phosphoglycerate dehydrogenase
MKIVVLEPLLIDDKKISAIEQFLGDTGHELVYHKNKPQSEKEIIERGKEADVIIVANLPITKGIITKFKKLKMISVAFTGTDHIDLEACNKKSITVCNAAGYSTTAVAELTIGLIIDVYRKITELHSSTKKGGDKLGFLGAELAGKTAGVIGLGKIGFRVARLLKAFGCDVIIHNRSNSENVKKFNVSNKPLDFLLKKSDIVSIHVPLTSETKHLIGKKEIELMKENAILVNTARGPIVDYEGLANALENGKIAGAGIDVYEKEPPIETSHPILNAPNVVTLPHIGYATKEAIDVRADIVFENILLWEQGQPQNIVK